MFAERWNGSTWAIQYPPTPAGSTNSALYSVSCTSASSCTAVGYSESASNVSFTLAEYWNGSTWAIQSTPNGTGSDSMLNGISCTSATACTAVGWTGNSTMVTLAERWNGSTWAIQTTPPDPDEGSVLGGVSCASATKCTAVGSSSFGMGALAERWNGLTWAKQTMANIGGFSAVLSGVSCPSVTACNGVGSYINEAGPAAGTYTLDERWNGSAWVFQTTPNPGGSDSVLNGVTCTSSTSCTSVGSRYDAASKLNRTLAEYWNGHAWAIQATVNGTGGSYLMAVSCTSATACTAVGYHKNLTLVERYS